MTFERTRMQKPRRDLDNDLSHRILGKAKLELKATSIKVIQKLFGDTKQNVSGVRKIMLYDPKSFHPISRHTRRNWPLRYVQRIHPLFGLSQYPRITGNRLESRKIRPRRLTARPSCRIWPSCSCIAAPKAPFHHAYIPRDSYNRN